MLAWARAELPAPIGVGSRASLPRSLTGHQPHQPATHLPPQETCCAGTLQAISDPRPNLVGFPIAPVELRLRDCVDPDGSPSVLDRRGKPYLSTDTSHYGTPCRGRGEVLIRGNSVSSGYLHNAKKTAGAFDEDGPCGCKGRWARRRGPRPARDERAREEGAGTCTLAWE